MGVMAKRRCSGTSPALIGAGAAKGFHLGLGVLMSENPFLTIYWKQSYACWTLGRQGGSLEPGRDGQDGGCGFPNP